MARLSRRLGSGRAAFVALNFASLVVTLTAAVLMGALQAPAWAYAAWIAMACAVWHAVSAARINGSGWPWLHAAPYLSVAAVLTVLLIAAGFHDNPNTPFWPSVMYFLGLLGMFSWPAATLAALVRDPHAAA